jgi:hypothetical protein
MPTCDRLFDVIRTLAPELDTGAILDGVLKAARELTGARYAAPGIPTSDRRELARFLTDGLGEETQRAIGPGPHPR